MVKQETKTSLSRDAPSRNIIHDMVAEGSFVGSVWIVFGWWLCQIKVDFNVSGNQVCVTCFFVGIHSTCSHLYNLVYKVGMSCILGVEYAIYHLYSFIRHYTTSQNTTVTSMEHLSCTISKSEK